MDSGSTTITNPHTGENKTFTFDHSYWSHDGFVEKDSLLIPENADSIYADQVVFILSIMKYICFINNYSLSEVGGNA